MLYPAEVCLTKVTAAPSLEDVGFLLLEVAISFLTFLMGTGPEVDGLVELGLLVPTPSERQVKSTV